MQHGEVVVELQQQAVTGAKAFQHVGSNTAQVSQYAQGLVLPGQPELAGLRRIVGYCHRPDLHSADTECVLAVEAVQAVTAITAAGAGGAVAKVDGDTELAGQGRHPGAVIGMFMGDQNGIQLAGLHSQPLQPARGFTQGKAAVDHQQGVTGPDQGGIALAPRAQ